MQTTDSGEVQSSYNGAYAAGMFIGFGVAYYGTGYYEYYGKSEADRFPLPWPRFDMGGAFRMASIADIVTGYQAAKRAYEMAVACAADCPDPRRTSQSLDIAARAVSAAANAVQTARLAADARERLGPEMTEMLLESACKAATFASDAARMACDAAIGIAPVDESTGEMRATTAIFASPLKQG